MPEDVDHRLAQVVVDLVRLSHMLPPEDFADMLGAVSVEVETGLELVLERRYTRTIQDNVVVFPGKRAQAPDGPTR